MYLRVWLLALPASVCLLAAADTTWKDKPAAEWNEDDTHQILNDSPWAKTAKATLDRSPNAGQRRSGGGMGRGGGIGIGGIGIGLPGMGGIGRRGGMGYPGGGYPGGGYPNGGPPGGGQDPAGANSAEAPSLLLRWESASPVREAELRARETNAPTIDENHYAIAVYGLPRRAVDGDSQAVGKQLKKLAAIKRDGKKDLKPSSVEVIEREDGPVVVYLFPRTQEITRRDKRLEFDGQAGRFQFSQSFFVDDMNYHGKIDL